MAHIELSEIKNKEDLFKLLNKDENLSIVADKTFDITLLDTININNVDLKVFLNKNTPTDIWTKIPNIESLLIHSSYEVQLNNINFLKEFKFLKSLQLTSEYTKKNLSFKSLQHISSLKKFAFVSGLTNQYQFLNQQNNLESLEVSSLDLELVTNKENLQTLRVDRTLKSENLISEKFPNLLNLHLHGCSRLTQHSFLSKLEKIQNISINYNSHLTDFPKIKNPELVKTIEMLTCPNFSSIDSLLQFKNLEQLALTSYDKPLQVSIQDFEKLKQLKKLKTVYTAWGRRPIKDLEIISEIYKTTEWKNSK